MLSLEAADRPRMRWDLRKLSCCEIADGVLCVLGRDWPDQMTTDTANPIAVPEYLGQADHLDSKSPTR